MTRRELIKRAAVLIPACRAGLIAEVNSINGKLNEAISRIKPPSFPARDFDIAKYGAVGDGEKLCTDAIKKAIQACSAAGGGRVVVPKGTFLTGAVHLENNVDLHVAEAATLLFSRDPKDYLPVVFTRFESTECMNYSPFIYAFEKRNIAITGPGTLDGNADDEHWWFWGRKARNSNSADLHESSDVQMLVEELGAKDVPVEQRVFGDRHFLRPNFVQPCRCQNVLMDGFTVKRSPMWELNPTLSQNVTIRNITIDSHGPNNDGIDPDACRDVLIEKCTFNTGDDCIAIKSGRNRDGRRVGVPCENVIIQDCDMKDGHGGVSIGSEVSGGIKDIYVRRCRMSSPQLQRALRIKTNSYRGGEINGISFTDVTVGQVSEAVVNVDFYYEEGEGGPFKPIVKNVSVSHVISEKSKYGVYLRGFADDPISGVTLSHCTFSNVAEGNFVKDVQGIQVENVLVNGKPLSAEQLHS